MPTIALVATIWARTGQGYTFWILLLAGVLSGLIMEAWVFFLPKLKGERGTEAWLRELIWLALMAVIGTITFFVTVSTFRLGLSPLSWFFAAVFGAAGWFIGDLFNQYITFRQTGFKRVR